MTEKLSLKAARRIALAAQGFADRRPDPPVTARQVRRMIDRLGLLQIDSVSVVVRAHYLPLFSRLGPYDRALLEADAWGRRPRLFEYWAHEASLLPLDFQPLLRWRMEAARRNEGIYGGLATFAAEKRAYVDGVLEEIAKRGPTIASHLEGEKGEGGWWGWSERKRALEWLFWTGHLTTATRKGFERVYDLPERVFPREVLDRPTPSPQDAQRALLLHAAEALGIATAGDLRDYFRQGPEAAKAHLPELVEEGKLIPVQVESWANPAYLHVGARRPRRVEARALLAPFDPLVWERARTERLFNFRYRLEIYTPLEKRVHGYYVLPFLLGEALVARVDLKSDRAASTLRVLAAHAEPLAPPETATALKAELRTLADWLGLEHVAISPAGDLAPALLAA